MLTWEVVYTNPFTLQRLKVPGGWLVVGDWPSRDNDAYGGPSFMPDPEHTWDAVKPYEKPCHELPAG